MKKLKTIIKRIKENPKPIRSILMRLKQTMSLLFFIPPKPHEKVKIFETFFIPANKKNNLLILFASYSPESKLSKSLFFYLEELRKLGADIAFCTTMKESFTEDDLIFLRQQCFLIIRRENIGLDFGSWHCLINHIDDTINYNRIILANDSVLGPLYPLEPLLEQFKKLELDYAGLTSSHHVKYHYQSYFLIFGKKLINSTLWIDFWKNFKYYHSKERIIRRYEVDFSDLILNCNFKTKAFWDYDQVVKDLCLNMEVNYNPTLKWGVHLCEKLNFPFLKKSLFKEKNGNIPSLNFPWQDESKNN